MTGFIALFPQWAVLTCGHCFCNECIAIIVEQYSVGSRRRAIKCAICRQTTSHTEISYVFTAQSSSQDQDIPVKVGQRDTCPFILLFWTYLLDLLSEVVNFTLFHIVPPPGVSQGSHSTKVEAVVRTLKKIQVTDPGAKCLVFSTVMANYADTVRFILNVHSLILTMFCCFHCLHSG